MAPKKLKKATKTPAKSTPSKAKSSPREQFPWKETFAAAFESNRIEPDGFVFVCELDGRHPSYAYHAGRRNEVKVRVVDGTHVYAEVPKNIVRKRKRNGTY